MNHAVQPFMGNEVEVAPFFHPFIAQFSADDYQRGSHSLMEVRIEVV
jgi:hypothetical protein